MYTSWPERPPWKYYKLKELPFVTWLGQQLDRNVYRGGTTLHCYKERCLPVCYFCLKRQYLVYTMVCSLLKTIPQILKGCNKITLACQSSTKFLSLNIIKSESKGPILVYVIEQPRQLKLIPFLCVWEGGRGFVQLVCRSCTCTSKHTILGAMDQFWLLGDLEMCSKISTHRFSFSPLPEKWLPWLGLNPHLRSWQWNILAAGPLQWVVHNGFNLNWIYFLLAET